MAILPDYVTGTITLTNGSTAVTGTGTAWDVAPVRAGDMIFFVEGAEEWSVVIGADASEPDELTLADPWPGPTSEDKTYRIRFQPDGSRYSAAAAQIVEQLGNGNIVAFSELVGSDGKVPVFTGPGAMTLLNSSELVNGVVYDVMVDDIAARAAYNGQTEGFSVLVADSGDGRSALYSKASNSSGDWSDPAYITGPVASVAVDDVTEGDYGSAPAVTATPVPGGVELDFMLPGSPTVAIGDVATLDPGDSATASFEPVTGGFELNLGIPAGEGFSFKGAYDGDTTYVLGDVVTYNGSSYIATQPGVGNLPTNPSFWDVLALRGIDGDDGENGEGTVAGVIGGAGVSVDDTDPTQPIVSLSLADLPWLSKPIGEPFPLMTDKAGVEPPPTDSPHYRYIELTAGLTGGGEYNEGVLTSESTSGSAPLVLATAVIDLAESPMDGQTIRLLNTEQRFLRAAATPGTVQDDQMQQITGAAGFARMSDGTSILGTGAGAMTRAPASGAALARSSAAPSTSLSADVTSFDSANSPNARTGTETRPKNIGVKYFMRIL